MFNLSNFVQKWRCPFTCNIWNISCWRWSSVFLHVGNIVWNTFKIFVQSGSTFSLQINQLFWGSLFKFHNHKISIYTLQAIKKVSNFLKTNILPGAISEVGLLCCACIHSNPELAISHLVEPLLSSVISSLKGIPLTGFGGSGNFTSQSLNKVFILQFYFSYATCVAD